MIELSTPPLGTHRDQIVLAHGGGGQLTDDLLNDVIRPRFANAMLDELGDSAVLEAGPARLAFTTDAYVVHPLEFPGGDIGRLAICGTVNDLAVAGADPRWIALSLIVEEGLAIATLERVLDSAKLAAAEAGVQVVTGDTKVVARGQADGLYVTTSGVGVMRPGLDLGPARVRPGDAMLVSGTIADHGMAVMLQREDAVGVRSDLRSDAAPINGLVRALVEAAPGVRFMRDPTRAGLAGVLADLAEQSGRRITIDEVEIPMRPETLYAAEMLGIDPLDVANEGKVVAVVPAGEADAAIDAVRAHEYGRDAAVIGRVAGDDDGVCELVTDVGGRRVLLKAYGEELPRIC